MEADRPPKGPHLCHSLIQNVFLAIDKVGPSVSIMPPTSKIPRTAPGWEEPVQPPSWTLLR